MLLSAQRSLNARAYTRGVRAVPAARPVQHAARVSRTPMRVQSLRVANTEIPNGKRLEISLQYILGIGQTKAREIVGNTGIENKKIYELSEEEINAIREEVGKHTTESDLRRMNTLNIKRLRDIGCYRGRRHLMGLPVRGQRTKTNSRTRKGKRKTVANKKK